MCAGRGAVCSTFARLHPTTLPSSSFTVFPHPISSVAVITPGRSTGERLARLIVVVPLEPTEKGWNFDSLGLMMSSNRSTALPGVVDEGDAGVSPPHAAQSETMIGTRAANRMINI